MGKYISPTAKSASASDMTNPFGNVCNEVFEIIMNMIKPFPNIATALGNQLTMKNQDVAIRNMSFWHCQLKPVKAERLINQNYLDAPPMVLLSFKLQRS